MQIVTACVRLLYKKKGKTNGAKMLDDLTRKEEAASFPAVPHLSRAGRRQRKRTNTKIVQKLCLSAPAAPRSRLTPAERCPVRSP